MATSKIYKTGTGWQAGVLKTWKTGTGWHIYPKYKELNGGWVNLYTDLLEPLSLSPNTSNIVKWDDTPSHAAMYAGILWKADGYEYENNYPGNTRVYGQSRGIWCDTGDPTTAYIERSYTGVIPYVDDIGSGRVQMNQDREYCIRDPIYGGGSQSSSVTFDFYDVPSGGSPISTVTLLLDAWWSDEPI